MQTKNKDGVLQQLKYGLYLPTHPMDGFWDLKHAKRGSLKSSFIIIGVFFLSVLVSRQLTAWQFNNNSPESLNVFTLFFTSLGPYAMWCLSTWCITSLMDGQGTMGDIVKATSYALVPVTITNFICVILSNIIVGRELMLYTIIGGVGLYWSLGLIFLSVISIHEYTLGKAVLIALLSLLGIVVIACLGILLFYLVQQLVGFGTDVLKEFTLRAAE